MLDFITFLISAHYVNVRPSNFIELIHLDTPKCNCSTGLFKTIHSNCKKKQNFAKTLET